MPSIANLWFQLSLLTLAQLAFLQRLIDSTNARWGRMQEWRPWRSQLARSPLQPRLERTIEQRRIVASWIVSCPSRERRNNDRLIKILHIGGMLGRSGDVTFENTQLHLSSARGNRRIYASTGVKLNKWKFDGRFCSREHKISTAPSRTRRGIRNF